MSKDLEREALLRITHVTPVNGRARHASPSHAHLSFLLICFLGPFQRATGQIQVML